LAALLSSLLLGGIAFAQTPADTALGFTVLECPRVDADEVYGLLATDLGDDVVLTRTTPDKSAQSAPNGARLVVQCITSDHAPDAVEVSLSGPDAGELKRRINPATDAVDTSLERVIVYNAVELYSEYEVVRAAAAQQAREREDAPQEAAESIDGGPDTDIGKAAPKSRRTMQLEAAAVGFFGASGAMSPGARLGFEFRPWDRFGVAAGGTLVTTRSETELGDVSGLRIAGDLAATVRHLSGSIVSSAAGGARAGQVRFEGEGDAGQVAELLYAQAFFRGRGEWSFAPAWFLLFQMELALAIKPAEALAGGAVVEEIRGIEADLSLGVGFRF
jgi:hypothetical protein